MITTDKVYENKNKNVRYKETDELGGFDPYSSSKAASEIAIRSFQRSFFNKKNDPLIATARAGNIIGGGDWSSSRLLPDIIKSYFKKNILAIRFPNSIRPWQHVLEPIYGYLILSQKLFEKNYSYSGSWNFGPNPSNFLTVKELLKKINLYQRLNIKWKKINNNQFHEASLLMLNNDKAKKNLKWRPVLTVKEMIDFTIDWYKNMNKKNNDLLSLTIKQINYFIKKI
jgi:CDP-glucose 4,6-dehydratase